MDLKEYLATRAAEVDAALDAFLPKAKEKPVVTGLVTVAGVIAFGIGVWLVLKHDLVDRARELVGLG